MRIESSDFLVARIVSPIVIAMLLAHAGCGTADPRPEDALGHAVEAPAGRDLASRSGGASIGGRLTVPPARGVRWATLEATPRFSPRESSPVDAALGSGAVLGGLAPESGPPPSDALWSPTPALSPGRRRHTAELLPDGHVLVTGGFDPSGSASRSSQRYDPSSGTWVTPAPLLLASARAEHTATRLIDGQVLAVGGYTGVHVATSELYNHVSNGWTTRRALPQGRYRHTATLLDTGEVLVAGGATTGAAYSNGSYRYDPASDAWLPTTGTMAGGRRLHTATLLRTGEVFVTGGDRSSTGPFYSWRTTERYNRMSDGWTTGPNMVSERTQHTATLLDDGRVLVVGYASEAEIYDPSTDGFTSAGFMTVDPGRYRHSASLLSNGCVLIAGGQIGLADAPTLLDTTQLYDPRTNQWSSSLIMTSRRTRHTATRLVDGSVLLAGGETSAGTSDIVERYVLGDSGAPCNTGCECASGFCADGFCCNTQCDDDCHACSVAGGAAANGSCTPLSGTSCSDGDRCTLGDTCADGSCVAASTVTCSRLDDCHEVGSCNPATGVCSNPARSDGTSCDDGNACTLGDACRAGACSGTAVTCAALNDCHEPICDAVAGCGNRQKEDGAACDDGDPCTDNDSCQSGECAGEVRRCQATDPCHEDGVCVLQNGVCDAPVKGDGAPCEEGNLCTLGDSCQAGVCVPGDELKRCPGTNECQLDGACEPETGECFPRKLDHTRCTGGVCIAGECRPDAELRPPVGEGGSSVDSGSGGNNPDDDPGCGCSAVGRAHDRPGAAALALLCALATASRAGRRRRCPAPTSLR